MQHLDFRKTLILTNYETIDKDKLSMERGQEYSKKLFSDVNKMLYHFDCSASKVVNCGFELYVQIDDQDRPVDSIKRILFMKNME